MGYRGKGRENRKVNLAFKKVLDSEEKILSGLIALKYQKSNRINILFLRVTRVWHLHGKVKISEAEGFSKITVLE